MTKQQVGGNFRIFIEFNREASMMHIIALYFLIYATVCIIALYLYTFLHNILSNCHKTLIKRNCFYIFIEV